MKVQIEESWRRQLQEEFDKPYFEHLVGFVKEEYARYTVFPPGSRIFHAYNTCPFEKLIFQPFVKSFWGRIPITSRGSITDFAFR